MWQRGDRLTHRYNSGLGPGRVVSADGRRLVVEFPESGETLSFVADADALVPLVLGPGTRVRLESTGEVVTVASELGGGRLELEDGREVDLDQAWPVPVEPSALERLKAGDVDSFEDFVNRVDALRLERLRQVEGIGSFLGGRIRLYAHQLYAAERACANDPVRWLLADGVGLGKTVEACLVMNRLIHTGSAERVLVVAPESLTVQWLGELWRKHHQVFVLLDEARIAEVAADQGEDFNPFEVHRRAIISLERLVEDRRLVEKAVAVGIDLLVVDEAHHLHRPEGHPGNAAYRAIAPVAALGRHLLLLTATPLDEDALGFMRLVQLLRPDELPDDQPLLERLARRQALPSCTSATRAVDIGGWPPREPAPVAFEPEQWDAFAGLEQQVRELPAGNEVAQARKAALVARALASPAALAASWRAKDGDIGELLREAEDNDPRIDWLVEHCRRWREQGQKTLVFVAHRETLESLRTALERRAHLRTGIFHEELSVKRRDMEVAQLRLAEGPSMLITTECGGEGRNFEFCDRLVLFDMPWHPAVVEQRIGRLDRIGRDRPTEIVYFKPPQGVGAAVVQLFEQMGLFERSVGSLGQELRHVAREIARLAAGDAGELDPSILSDVLERARSAMSRVERAACHELHQEPYRAEMAEEILARVPPELETLTADVVLRAASRFGFEVEQQRGRAVWFVELGTEALVDRLPGVAPGSRFLGTFDREEAVRQEELDFFASGHPLVEGILAELEEGPRGRAACVQVAGPADLFGLLAVYRNGADFEVVAVDAAGEQRPELAELLLGPDVVAEPVDAKMWSGVPGWKKAIRRIARALPEGETPHAVVAFRVRAA